MKKVVLAITSSVMFFISCSSGTQSAFTVTPQKSISQKFVGQWKFYAPYHNDKAYDGTMDNVVSGLEKLPNTDESFVFHFWFGRDAILSVKDDSTLIGKNISMLIRYRPSNDHLFILHSDEKSGLEFAKLK